MDVVHGILVTVWEACQPCVIRVLIMRSLSMAGRSGLIVMVSSVAIPAACTACSGVASAR